MKCPYCKNINKQKYPSNLRSYVHCGNCGKYHHIKDDK
ncbi:hypothetical protein LCGC14_0801700 [marine sediment metagenome]|uniref:Uncharacterized protein n=1 Tax=marine sediment metagenome TaxID=412755 RepID=A0A0F9Q9A4_9ZZZZ